jgi:hypothetical protein
MRLQISLMAPFAAAAALLTWGCSSRCDLATCDIREPACQRATAAGAACLRGVPPVDVPMKVMSRADYLAQAAREAAADPQSPDFGAWVAAMGLLGLGAPDLSVAAAAQDGAAWVGGFYSPRTKAITIIDFGQPLDSMAYVSMLAHEYTHALQDREIDFSSFDARYVNDTDSALAVSALVEGEATVVGDLAYLSQFGTDEKAVTWYGLFRGWQTSERKSAREDPNPALLAPLHFPYAFGALYVWDLRARKGWAEVRQSFSAPPIATRPILALADDVAPDLAEASVPVPDLSAHAVPALPGFDFVAVDHLGAWLFETFLERQQHDEDASQATARGLRGDVLAIVKQGESVVVSWRLRLRPELAAPFAAWLRGRRFSAWLDDDGDVVIVATNNPALSPQLVANVLQWKAAPADLAPTAPPMAAHRPLGCRFTPPQ